MAAPPKLLHIRGGEKQNECTGHYELQQTKANGEPLWKKRDGERWLYFGTDGKWYIGGKGEFDKNFNCASGWITQSARTAELPHTLRSLWQFGDGKVFADDSAITVEDATAEAAPLKLLRIRGGEKQKKCTGHYELQPTKANGEPLWKKRGGELWLYFCPAGKWYIWDKKAFDQNFNCARGFIAQSAPTAELPHTLRSLWQFSDGKVFADDPAITVEDVTAEAAPPKLLHIRTGEKQGRCTGHYELQPTKANGEPLWKKRGDEKWLYFCSAGKWYIWDKEAFDQNFNCARGWITQSARTAELPHTLRSPWRCWDGKVWADNEDMTVEEATAEAERPAAAAEAERPAAAAEETFPDGKDAVPGMFSARFDGGDIEHKFRSVHRILQEHNFPVLMVDAGVGDNFGKLTSKYLSKIEREKGVLICVCTAHYAEKTTSPFCSFKELEFARDYSLDVLPLKVADVYPPRPPGGPNHPHDQENDAADVIKYVFRPNLVYVDCRKLDEMEIARVIADKLLKKRQGAGYG